MSKILSNAVSLRNAVVADAVLSEAAPRVPVPDAVGLPQGQPVRGRKRWRPEGPGLTL